MSTNVRVHGNLTLVYSDEYMKGLSLLRFRYSNLFTRVVDREITIRSHFILQGQPSQRDAMTRQSVDLGSA